MSRLGRLSLAIFILVLCGCGQYSADIVPTPACNGAADEATPCLKKKILSWRIALGILGIDSTYDVYEAACGSDDPDGCWMLGRALVGDSYLTERMQDVHAFKPDRLDPERGAAMIEKSCDLGSEYGCLKYAGNLADEANWEPEEFKEGTIPKVMSYFYRSCESGFVSGCGGYFDLSLMLEPAPDIAKEKFAAKEICKHKIGKGCHTLGVYMMREADDESQHKLALPFWKLGCEYQYEDSCRAYAGNMGYFGDKAEYDWAIRTACGHGFDTGEWGAIDTVDYASCGALD